LHVDRINLPDDNPMIFGGIETDVNNHSVLIEKDWDTSSIHLSGVLVYK
jgi:hypothetical protein